MEVAVHAGVFLVVIVSVVLLEFGRPRRVLAWPRRARWVPNWTSYCSTLCSSGSPGTGQLMLPRRATVQDVGLSHWFAFPAWAAAIMPFW